MAKTQERGESGSRGKIVMAISGDAVSNERLRFISGTIAKNIARLRGAMSQEQLARKAGLSRQTVMAVERGQAVPLQNLIKLADALGVSPADLFITQEQLYQVNYLSIRLFEKLAEHLGKK